MHSILHLKANGLVSEEDQTFEERLRETCSGGFLVHNDRTELLEDSPELSCAS